MSQSLHNITFISTMHYEIGKCNADELCSILVKESPDVIFLEALENTYSNYEKHILNSFGVYHNKPEIKAIQKYSHNTTFEYVPVLDNELPELFDKKYSQVSENIEFQKMLDEYDSLASKKGFQFLNSEESTKLQVKMRILDNQLIKDNDLNEAVNKGLDDYENSMLRNIYSYCRDNQFEKAVFMCGVAHRLSIIEKLKNFGSKEKMDLNWIIFEN